MMHFSEILKSKLLERNMSVYKLSKLSGVSQPGLKSIIDGENSPSYDTISKICDGLNLTLSEFFIDETYMSEDAMRIVTLYNRANMQAQKSAFSVLRIGQDFPSYRDKEDELYPERAFHKPSFLVIPVVGKAAAGIPIEMIREYDTSLEVADNMIRPGDFAVIADGDSMIDAGINPGDRVVFRPQPTVEDGQIALIALEDGSTIKRFFRYKDTYSLVSENGNYPDQVYPRNSNIRILGKFVKVLKSFTEHNNSEMN